MFMAFQTTAYNFLSYLQGISDAGVRCHDQLHYLMCAIIVPKCGADNEPVPPCRSFCQGTYRGYSRWRTSTNGRLSTAAVHRRYTSNSSPNYTQVLVSFSCVMISEWVTLCQEWPAVSSSHCICLQRWRLTVSYTSPWCLIPSSSAALSSPPTTTAPSLATLLPRNVSGCDHYTYSSLCFFRPLVRARKARTSSVFCQVDILWYELLYRMIPKGRSSMLRVKSWFSLYSYVAL